MRLTGKDGPKATRLKERKARGENRNALHPSPRRLSDNPVSRSIALDSKYKTFLDLPPELRNEIYALSLPCDQVIDIHDAWPSILNTHKQVFDETFPIFLSGNTFSAHVKGRRDTVFAAWLDYVKGIREEHKAFIKCVSITFAHGIFNRKRGSHRCDPDLDLYREIIARIKDAGLKGSQLAFPGILPGSFPQGPSFEHDCHIFVPLHFLNRHVLTPLLKRYDLFDPANPPVDVEKQLRDDYEELLIWKPLRDSMLSTLREREKEEEVWCIY